MLFNPQESTSTPRMFTRSGVGVGASNPPNPPPPPISHPLTTQSQSGSSLACQA